MKLKTSTKTISLQEKREIVKKTIEWCKTNLGVYNRRRNKFKYSIRVQSKKDINKIGCEAMGQFECKTNTLTIYHNNNETVKDLVQTTIHEYTHYLQPISTYYRKYYKIYDYYSNPFEIEAFKNEKKYYKKCWKSIK
jgi:hypothetical protein